MRTASLWERRPSLGSGRVLGHLPQGDQWERTGCLQDRFRPHSTRGLYMLNFFFFSLIPKKNSKPCHKSNAQRGSQGKCSWRSFATPPPPVWGAAFHRSICAHPCGVRRGGESYPRPPPLCPWCAPRWRESTGPPPTLPGGQPLWATAPRGYEFRPSLTLASSRLSRSDCTPGLSRKEQLRG